MLGDCSLHETAPTATNVQNTGAGCDTGEMADAVDLGPLSILQSTCIVPNATAVCTELVVEKKCVEIVIYIVVELNFVYGSQGQISTVSICFCFGVCE